MTDPSMALPDGKACRDCAHIRRCTMLGTARPFNTSCDWSPSRFVEPASAADQDRVTLLLRGTRESCEEAERQRDFDLRGSDPLWLNNAIDATEAALDGVRQALALLRAEAKERRRLGRLSRAAEKAKRRSA